MKRKIHYCLLLILWGASLNAQSLLDRKLEGLANFHQIMEIVDAHYDSLHAIGIVSLPGERKYKHWKRWEWYASQHLDAHGRIVDIGRSTYSALQRQKARERQRPPVQLRTTNSNWNSIGPTVSPHSGIASADFPGLGRVDRIAFHPTNANTIFIGTPSGGLWKTTNQGNSWIAMTDDLPAIGISGIAIHPSSPDSMYLLTGDGDTGLNSSAGLFLSTDAGNTWKHLSDVTTDVYFAYDLVMVPDNPHILWAATTAGLFRSVDAGLSWSLIESGRFSDIELHPTNSAIVYACSWTEVVWSNDGNTGANFSNAAFDIPPFAEGRKCLATTAADPEIVYLLTGPQTGGGTFSGFYRSDSLGIFFEQQTTTPNVLGRTGSDDNDQSNIDLALAASPSDSAIALTGGLIIFKTTDSGGSFSAATSYGMDDEPWYVHPDIHDIKYQPLTGYVYAATDGGFYRSTDDGDTWTDLSEGIQTTMFYNLAGYAADETYLIGGTQDNGVKHRKTNTDEFFHIDCCDGFEVAFGPTHNLMYGSINKWLSKYTNNGSNKTDITPRSHWFMRVAAHVSDDQIVFAGAPDRMYKSIDQGSSWDTLWVEATHGIEMCPDNTNRMYIAGNVGPIHRLNRSDNLGGGFIRIDTNPGFPADSNLFITGISVNPTNSDEVWVSLSGLTAGKKIYYSSNAGSSWSNKSMDLPNVPFLCVEVNSNGDAFAGCTIGAFYLPNGYSEWIPFNNGLPRTRITDLIINEGAQLIRAGTYGRGAWEAFLPDGICDTNKYLIGNNEVVGELYYEASNSITTDFELTGGVPTQVYLKSGGFVDMKPGFLAPANGALFQAYIGDCTTGGLPGN